MDIPYVESHNYILHPPPLYLLAFVFILQSEKGGLYVRQTTYGT